MKDILYQLKDVQQISGATYFLCKLVKPASLKEGNVSSFRSSSTGFRWRVTTASFLPAKQWKKGMRMFGVIALPPSGDATIGDTLVGEYEA